MTLRSSFWATLSLVALASSFAACGGGPRLGGKGETCSRTDDCEAPLVCIAGSCQPPGSTGGSGGAGGTTTGGSAGMGGSAGKGGSAGMGGGTAGMGGGTAGMGGAAGTAGMGGGTGGSGGNGLDPKLCAECLDKTCATALAACDSDCLAIEACLETVCSNLSKIGSSEEGQCQVYCQQQYPAAKSKHLAVVNCAYGSNCPPCSSYPYDHNACVAEATLGVCAAQFKACNDSVDCKEYRDCVLPCATLQECLACDNSMSGMMGAPILLDYNQCIAAECIAESWLK